MNKYSMYTRFLSLRTWKANGDNSFLNIYFLLLSTVAGLYWRGSRYPSSITIYLYPIPAVSLENNPHKLIHTRQ